MDGPNRKCSYFCCENRIEEERKGFLSIKKNRLTL